MINTDNVNFIYNSVSFEISQDIIDDGCYNIRWYYNITELGKVGLYDYYGQETTTNYTYLNKGLYYPSINFQNDLGVYNYFQNQTVLKINTIPKINFTGSPIANSTISFYDENRFNYYTDTIEKLIWDFGDGTVTEVTDITASITHTYSSLGLYEITLQAVDTDGNYSSLVNGINKISISVLDDNPYCKIKTNLITIDGPEEIRYGDSKKINLVNLLPEMYEGTGVEEFLQVFEDFLNKMFQGNDGFKLLENEISVDKETVEGDGITDIEGYHDNYTYNINNTTYNTDAKEVNQVDMDWPEDFDKCENNRKISILEKVKRLTELRDIDLIDLEYIQFFAKNLGYNVNVYRNEIVGSSFGNIETLDNETDDIVNQRRYLRFVVQNLPNWYKIKTTNNSIKVMLYSFGLIGDLVELYTKDYSNDGSDWKIKEDNLISINNDWYPTSHFNIQLNIDRSDNLNFDIQKRGSIIRAIESVRPINTVFMGLTGILNRTAEVKIIPSMRVTKYIRINSDQPSDYFS